MINTKQKKIGKEKLILQSLWKHIETNHRQSSPRATAISRKFLVNTKLVNKIVLVLINGHSITTSLI